jgi:hypothetical protein
MTHCVSRISVFQHSSLSRLYVLLRQRAFHAFAVLMMSWHCSFIDGASFFLKNSTD